jgi:hypothetical protein
MYATCSGLSCSRRGTGLLSAGKLRSNPNDPLYRPSPMSVSMSRRYVLQVATSHRPSAETSTPRMGSPRAGRAVFHQHKQSNTHLGVLPDLIEQAYIALITRHYQLSRLSRRRSREVVLGCILLELRFHQFVTVDSRIYPEKPIMGCDGSVS